LFLCDVVVEGYIDYLIHNNLYQFVALYASELCLPRRVAMYMHMFLIMNDPLLMHVSESTATIETLETKIVHGAMQLFPHDLLAVSRLFGHILVSSGHYASRLDACLPSASVYETTIGFDIGSKIESWKHKVSGLQFLFASDVGANAVDGGNEQSATLTMMRYFVAVQSLNRLCAHAVLQQAHDGVGAGYGGPALQAAVPRIAEALTTYRKQLGPLFTAASNDTSNQDSTSEVGGTVFGLQGGDALVESSSFKMLLFWKSYVDAVEVTERTSIHL
jgi:hypothetical protein